ncbi:hypothetical protein JKP88DRAFT_353162 [Tribonema minus]|uniref:Uncharacterized protein n=1 Tax=Tribonema minus TaxID=303371 RepID=A0A835ZDD7_9STRA|nr:hypothetical protein JKP88DRAFT_353162 [Tribonema minus]
MAWITVLESYGRLGKQSDRIRRERRELQRGAQQVSGAVEEELAELEELPGLAEIEALRLVEEVVAAATFARNVEQGCGVSIGALRMILERQEQQERQPAQPAANAFITPPRRPQGTVRMHPATAPTQSFWQLLQGGNVQRALHNWQYGSRCFGTDGLRLNHLQLSASQRDTAAPLPATSAAQHGHPPAAQWSVTDSAAPLLLSDALTILNEIFIGMRDLVHGGAQAPGAAGPYALVDLTATPRCLFLDAATAPLKPLLAVGQAQRFATGCALDPRGAEGSSAQYIIQSAVDDVHGVLERFHSAVMAWAHRHFPNTAVPWALPPSVILDFGPTSLRFEQLVRNAEVLKNQAVAMVASATAAKRLAAHNRPGTDDRNVRSRLMAPAADGGGGDGGGSGWGGSGYGITRNDLRARGACINHYAERPCLSDTCPY